MRYIGLLSLPYRYRIQVVNDQVIVRVRIHFKNADAGQLSKMREMLARAGEVWNRQTVRADLLFRFEVSESETDSDFSVAVTDREIRGFYLRRWSTAWSGTSAAHEIGHMLGLDDEYPQAVMSVNSRKFYENVGKWCDPDSLMCQSFTGSPRPEHVYLVVRHAFCR